MGESGRLSGDWNNERISMTHLANFSRSSSYVRSLVRQQFHPQSDQPNTAWERLRERLAKHSSFEYDDEMPSFMKKRERASLCNYEENTSENEDEDEEEETYAFLKPANPNHRSSVAAEVGNGKRRTEQNETVSASHGNNSASSSRRLSAPPTALSNNVESEKQYTLPSTDAHSKILNRRLSLAENVIRNYSKYIRTPDESQTKRNTLVDVYAENGKGGQKPMNKQPLIAAISEEESSPFVDVKLVNCASPASSHSSDFLAVHGSFPGSSYTVPPSPVTKSGTTFFDVPVRRNSVSEVMSEDLSLTRSGTDVTPEATKDKLAADATNKLPRLSQTSKVKRGKLSANSRDEAIEKLREDYAKLSTKKRRQRVDKKRETVYRQLLRDQELRARESEIFLREMEQINKTLKSINHRLDERIKVLDCADPPKVNVRLQRILQVALAGVPLKNI